MRQRLHGALSHAARILIIVGGSSSGSFAAAVRCIFTAHSNSVAIGLPASDTSAWRAVVRVLRSTVDSLSCALFPATCVLCSNLLIHLAHIPVCDSCWGRLRPQAGVLCPRCGEDLGVESFWPHAGSDESFFSSTAQCRPCRLSPPAFERALAYGVYEAELRSLIHLLKYSSMRPIAGGLGRRMASCLLRLPAAERERIPREMLVIPVPMFRRKRRARGFDHAELLSRAMIHELHRQDMSRKLQLETGVLERRKATASQAGLTPRQRRQNLRGAFALSHPGRVRGRNVLLVDDIYTSGATARACSRVLREGGAASVWVVTAARAQREGVAFWSAATSQESMASA